MEVSQYTHKNSKGKTYYLNTKDITLRNGKEVAIFYFSKDGDRPEACALPSDKVVAESSRNGMLVLKGKK